MLPTAFWDWLKQVSAKTTVLSFLMAVVSGLLFGALIGASFGEIKSFWPFAYNSHNQHLSVIASVSAFLVVFSISYVFLLKEGDDYLTPLRKSLVGTWDVSYQKWDLSWDGAWEKTNNDFEIADFGINITTRKLYLRSSLHKHGVFKAYSTDINNISIDTLSNPMEMIFSYPLELKTHDEEAVSSRIFVRLTIFSDNNSSRPNRLSGKWFDLEGNIAKGMHSYFARQGRSPTGKIEDSGDVTYTRHTGTSSSSAT